MQQHGSPVRPDYKRGVHRVGHAEVLAEAGRVWGRHRRDKEPVGVFRGSWGGCSVGWAGVGWGRMSQVGTQRVTPPSFCGQNRILPPLRGRGDAVIP